MNFCRSCGTKLESTKFCTNCGATVASSIAPPPKFDNGAYSASTQARTQAPKTPPKAPTCFECGQEVLPGQFLCANCQTRKAQPRTQASPGPPSYYSPPAQKSNKVWILTTLLVVIMGGTWFGISTVISRRATAEAAAVAEAAATKQRQEQAQSDAVQQAANERQQAENIRNQQAQVAAQRATQNALQRQAYIDSQRNNQKQSESASSQVANNDYAFESLVSKFRTAKSKADMASSFGQGTTLNMYEMVNLANQMSELAQYTSDPRGNSQTAVNCMEIAVRYK